MPKSGELHSTTWASKWFCTSERLYDHQREAISSAFACPVANGYGGRDAGFIAHECPAGGMHITAEDIIVEIIDENGSIQPTGIAGEIVVTHLATSDFPFIRYRTGDVGSLSTENVLAAVACRSLRKFREEARTSSLPLMARSCMDWHLSTFCVTFLA